MEGFTLEARDICVEFPGVRALDHANFRVTAGEIHALVGANGAGKSTLMKVLSGVNPTYTGEIWIDGRPVELRRPAAARRLGIQTVYQEVDAALVPSLSAAENILLDDLGSRDAGAWVDWRSLYAEAEELLGLLHMDMDVRARVDRLPLAQKQMVLIARALRSRCRLLLLDEPTAPLGRAETETLFGLCRRLAEEQRLAIVFISHRLPEILQICDRYTVMRGGAIAGTAPITPHTTAEELTERMLGGSSQQAVPRSPARPGGVLLSARGLSNGENSVRNVSLTVREGEIVGLAGLVGAGKSELCKTLFGALPKAAGTVELDGRPVEFRSPADAVRHGVGLVPEERRKEGLLLSESVAFNLAAASLKRWSRLSFLSPRRMEENAEGHIRRLGIKTPSSRQQTGLLSGGNQQKTVVGKWLAAGCRLCIFDEPTKGVDIGAKAELLRIISGLAREGRGVLYASGETGELLAVTDRIYVMYGGEIAAELVTAETSEEEIMHYATGGRAPFHGGPAEKREDRP